MNWLLLFIFAFLFDVVNILLGILDFLVIGLILSPIWNAFAVATLGLWLWSTTGQGARGPTQLENKRLASFLAKRIALPFLGNSIPISKFFPWWVWSVWSSYRSSQRASSQTEPEEQERQLEGEQPQTPSAPA